jgi:hypothetical protein
LEVIIRKAQFNKGASVTDSNDERNLVREEAIGTSIKYEKETVPLQVNQDSQTVAQQYH